MAYAHKASRSAQTAVSDPPGPLCRFRCPPFIGQWSEYGSSGWMYRACNKSNKIPVGLRNTHQVNSVLTTTLLNNHLHWAITFWRLNALIDGQVLFLKNLLTAQYCSNFSSDIVVLRKLNIHPHQLNFFTTYQTHYFSSTSSKEKLVKIILTGSPAITGGAELVSVHLIDDSSSRWCSASIFELNAATCGHSLIHQVNA